MTAIPEASPTIEGALRFVLDKAAIFYPFTDLLLPDPHAVMTDKVLHAFYIGPSGAVGGVPTEAVAGATKEAFFQTWVGTDDKHMLLSNWQLDVAHAEGTFASPNAQAAQRMAFAKPVAVPPQAGGKPAAKAAKLAKPAASVPAGKTS